MGERSTEISLYQLSSLSAVLILLLQTSLQVNATLFKKPTKIYNFRHKLLYSVPSKNSGIRSRK